jgi:uroporphyrin-III C-methyltransferase
MRALVLAAHGSRRDPAANALVRRYAEEIRRRRLFDEVAVAFHQGEPGFDTALDELTADEVTVVPFMTSAGHYSETVLPAALARNRRYSEIRLRQTPALGTHPGIAALVARRVTQLLRNEELTRDAVSLVLVGHGTARHPDSRAATLHLAETLELRRVAGQVLAGFIDDEPPVEQALERARHSVALVIPFLIGGGAHALVDLPQTVAISGDPGREARSRVLLDQAVGSYPGLVELVIDLARRHPPPPPRPRRRGGRQSTKATGTVYLVGAGPGDPGLITARGLELLREADVVVHDRLIGPELLLEARAGAELVDVGKGRGHAALSQEQINQLLVDAAREGKTVVRLKGGDPFVFGRGSEELAACRESGISCEVVPGVSSAIAAPAAANIPVTARGLAGSFAVITGHRAGPDGGDTADLGAFASVDTLVLLMGRERLAEIAEQLIRAGRDPATPAACIQSATTAAQRVTLATLGTIAEAADRDGLEAPVVTVIGAVAGLAMPSPARPLRLESLVVGLGA